MTLIQEAEVDQITPPTDTHQAQNLEEEAINQMPEYNAGATREDVLQAVDGYAIKHGVSHTQMLEKTVLNLIQNFHPKEIILMPNQEGKTVLVSALLTMPTCMEIFLS